MCVPAMLCSSHTHKQKQLILAAEERSARKQLRLCHGVRTRAVLSYFCFFFYKFTLAFPPTTLKSILYLLGHKNVCEERWLFDGLRVGFQLLEHLSIIYQIDFQPW